MSCWAPIEDESDKAVGLRTPCMTWQATPHLGALHVVCALRNPSRGRGSAMGWKWTNYETTPTHARLPAIPG